MLRHAIARSRRLCSSHAVAGDDAPLNILLVLGSTRAKRIGGRVADHVGARIAARGHTLTVLDPRESHGGFFMRLMEKAFFHYKSGEGEEAPPPALAAAAAQVRAADAYVVVTPEYNHTIAPALTNTMNYFGGSLYADKASGIATYSAGMWGGARCGAALRPYLSELGCLPVSATMQLAGAWKPGTFDAETGLLPEGAMGAKLCERMLDQLEWTAKALRAKRRQDLAAAEAE